MRLLSRTLFLEILASAMLGCILFTLVLFLDFTRTLFEFLVRDSGAPRLVADLFALVLPQALPYAIPLGVLVGTLITLSRMSSDGEITAMRAAGVSGRRVAPPILAFGCAMTLVAAVASLWLTPWAIRERYKIQNRLIAGQLTAEVQARVFQEQFPNSILYITDIPSSVNTRWHRIFLADVTPSAERGNSPRVTLASDAIAVPDAAHNRMQLSLSNASTYEVSKDSSEYKVSSSPGQDLLLQARRNSEVEPSRPVIQMDTGPLYKLAYGDQRDPERTLEARIELNQRLALPLACMLLALAGIPLGVGSRRAGKSSAYVLTVALAFLYFIGLITAIHFGRQGTIPAGFAVWIPNLVFAILGFAMLARLEAPGDRDYIGRLTRLFRAASRAPQEHIPRLLDRIQPRIWKPRFPLLPQVLDTYLLSSFLFYFVLWLASFVLMFHVFTFFELLSDIIKNHIPMSRVFTYLFFLSPRLIYRFTPISVLTSVLVVFGVLAKNNEVTAFKACGVSMYRLTVPILACGILLSGGLFAFDHYWVPEADRLQDAIRAEIKGRPAQTFSPGRTWFYGQEDRIYYYKYFDQSARVMGGVNVFEIDPKEFRLKRHIVAQQARWEPALSAWVFQNGWSRDLKGNETGPVVDFAGGSQVFPELKETPEYFVKEALQSQQMNFLELRSYIDELQQSGFDTIALQVQLYKKFSVPLFAFILALVAAPFAFAAGNRGGMAGVGMSFAIFIAYQLVDQFFEQLGNLNELPPQLAAWSPDVVFSLVGLYFLARMRT